MRNPEIYVKNDSSQKELCSEILNVCFPKLDWSTEEHVLDVGSGPGDMTAELILPRLPSNTSIVGIDYSSEMVDWANKNYASDRIKYHLLDFSSPDVLNVLKEQSFTKIISIHCLHYIEDQRSVGKNMYTLLRPGGAVLAIVHPNNGSIWNIYRALSKNEKWASFIKKQNNFDSLKNYKDDWAVEGIEICDYLNWEKTFSFSNEDAYKDFMEAVSPFVHDMDTNTKKEFMSDMTKTVVDLKIVTKTQSGEIYYNYECNIIIGIRPVNNK